MFSEQFHPREPTKVNVAVSIAGFFRFIHYFLRQPASRDQKISGDPAALESNLRNT